MGQNGVGTCTKCDATGNRRHEKPCKEELELLPHSTDLRFDGSLMRQAYNVGKSGDWKGFLENDKLSAWTSVQVGECYNEVEQKDEGPQSIAQQILHKRTDFLRRIIVPVVVCVPSFLTGIRLKSTSGESLEGTERSSATGGVRRAVASVIGRHQTESWSHKDGTDRQEAKVFRPHAAPNRVCDSLINALKLQAHHQKNSDSPAVVAQGLLLKRWLKIMDGLRRFIMLDNHEAVKVGDFAKKMESRPVVKPNFTTDFLEAVVREGGS